VALSPEAPTRLRALDRLILYATVMLTGGAVMVLELLGTRVIGPYYGVSLYVWSSLIAVTLIALATGYYLGGWCADHVPRLRLAHLLVVAALATFLIPLVSGPVLTRTNPLGMRAGAFVSALLLFTAPLTCLGMAGPFVIKLATRSLDRVGTAAGSVYAVSTIGSVLGTVALGFWLLPLFGTRGIVIGTGTLLLVLGLVLTGYERRRFGRVQSLALGAIGVSCLATLFSGTLLPERSAPGFTVRHDAESTYGWVRVVDDERNGFRLLLSDASILSAIRLVGEQSVLSYQQLLYALPSFRPESQSPIARRALLIGLGGGHVANYMQSRGIATDTIEIDPAVAHAALSYFGFLPGGQFVIGDARYEIDRLPGPYDFIIHDCFTGGSEPSHLLTIEMLEKLRERLSDRGLLAVNVVGFARGPGAAAVASVHRTLAQLFPYQRTFVTVPGGEFTDFLFLASRQAIHFSPQDDDERVILNRMMRYEQAPPAEGGIVITDDFNPLEYLQAPKAERYREMFLERVALSLLLR
jgi:spermidine synthase